MNNFLCIIVSLKNNLSDMSFEISRVYFVFNFGLNFCSEIIIFIKQF